MPSNAKALHPASLTGPGGNAATRNETEFVLVKEAGGEWHSASIITSMIAASQGQFAREALGVFSEIVAISVTCRVHQ
ncbi:MAG: hypothetical protein ABSG46_11175 [Candidatus Binataceae bacterium]|jgi:hypothetical protein